MTDQTVVGDRSLLQPPGARPDLRGYLRQVWSMRHYAWESGDAEIRSLLAGTSLGVAWVFVEPLITIAIFWIIFGVLLDVARGVDNYIAFLTVGQVTFTWCQRTLLDTSGSLTRSTQLLRSLAMPRAVFPLAQALKSLSLARAEALILLVALGVMGSAPRNSWFALPIIGCAGVIISFGIGLALARLVYRMPDSQRVLTHLMRLAFYATGVFFPLDLFVGDRGWILKAAVANPFYDIVELMRWAMLGTRPDHHRWVLIATSIWIVVAVVLGTAVFRGGERSYSGARTMKR